MPELFTGGGLEAAVESASAGPDAGSVSAVDTSSAAAEASSAAGAATTGQAASGDTSATTQGDPATQQNDPTKKTAEPPQEKWPTILDNARKKAVEETEGKYSWAKTIPEQHRSTVSQFYALLDAEPTQAVEVLIGQIANDPQHAPKLRSLFGRLLGNRANPSQPAAASGDALPSADFRDEHTGATFYSAERMPELVAAIEARIDAKYSKKYGPLEQDFRTRQTRDVEAKAKSDAATWADTEYARISSSYPHFTEHEAAIAQAMEADHQLGVEAAYIQVVIPKLQTQERKAVVGDMHLKANASGVNPNNAVSAVSKPPRTMEEGFAQYAGSLG